MIVKNRLASSIFIIMLAMALAYHYYPQGLAWYNGLPENIRDLLPPIMVSGALLGLFLGVFLAVVISRVRDMLFSLFLGLLGSVINGVAIDALIGTAFALTFLACYFGSFFLMRLLIKRVRARKTQST